MLICSTNLLGQEQIRISPMSNYVMGKCVKLSYSFANKRHVWRLGISTHVSPFKDEYSVTNNVNRNNGLTVYWHNYIHPTISYDRVVKINSDLSLLLYLELMGGTITLSNKFYNMMEVGVDTVYNQTILSKENGPTKAVFLQVNVGIGFDVRLVGHTHLTMCSGFSNSISRIVVPIDKRERQIIKPVDYLFFNYQVGLTYVFN